MYAPEKENGLGLYAKRRGFLGAAPLVATVASAGAKKIFGGISFKTPSEVRARRVIPAVVASANQGNLRAVAVLDTRRNIGIARERAEWARGYGQVTPSVLASYQTVQASRSRIDVPASAQSGPEAAATWALQTPVTPQQTAIEKVADVVVPAFLETQAGREVKQAAVESAVQSEVAKAGESLKGLAIPLAIGAAFLLFRK